MFQSGNERPSRSCPLCGADNNCAGARGIAGKEKCWCTEAVISPMALARLPAKELNRACLCPRCASGETPPLA